MNIAEIAGRLQPMEVGFAVIPANVAGIRIPHSRFVPEPACLAVVNCRLERF